MKKIAVSLLLIFIVSAVILALPVQAVTQTETNQAVDLGLKWLANQQNTTNGAWNFGWYTVASTAFAVLKFEEYANKTLKMDPFSPAYEYSQNVIAGWKYIFANAIVQNISMQVDHNGVLDDNPDLCHDGYGIYFLSPGTVEPLYETGIVLMALEASWHPNTASTVPNPLVNGAYLTYKQVMEQTVDWISWAQNDYPNPGEGGWRYDAYNNSVLMVPSQWSYWAPYSDNSVSGFVVLGLISALGWGVKAPTWVATELNYWLAYSQNLGAGDYYGSFGYTSANDEPHIALTASGIVELYYEDLVNGIVPTTDLRVKAAFAFIVSDWTGSITGGTGEDLNIGNLYAMYDVMKACVLCGIVAPIPGVWGGMISNSTTSIDWQTDYDNWLVANQASDGHWAVQYEPNYDTTGVLGTEWALLILELAAPIPPPPPTVGGVAVPVAGFALLNSYISLVSIFAVAAVAMATYTKRVKRGKEKR